MSHSCSRPHTVATTAAPARAAAASTATGSATCMSSCTAATTSNGPGGGSSASRTAKVPSGTSAAARATAAGSVSMPVTRAPRSAAARANSPAPQPRSSTLVPGPTAVASSTAAYSGAPQPRGPSPVTRSSLFATPRPMAAPSHPGTRRCWRRKRAVRALFRRRLALFGPAFVAAIAYVDPGNFATNVSAGAQFGYLLLWVIVAANLMAMFVQSLSAKLGLATGASLPENCRQHYRRPVVVGLWLQAEVVAMATDLAEVVGGAIALNLLFGLPLFTGGLITGAVAFLLLALQTRGDRRFIGAVTALFGVILVAFVLLVMRVPIDPGAAVGGPGPPLRRRAEPRAGHRHPRRDRDAARDLPALRAGAERRLGDDGPAAAPGAHGAADRRH